MLDKSVDQGKLCIRKEEIDVKKEWVQTGEVKWHKEIVIEEKNFVVPVKREELIIEKYFVDITSPEQSISTEIIRIPIREERIEINKSTFDLEDVEIYKNQLQQITPIEVTQKKEVISIKLTGNPGFEEK